MVNGDQASIWHGYLDIQRRRYRGHDLDLWGHVTSSITWPSDFPWGVSYRWSMVTRRLSGTVIETFSLEDIGVTSLTFWGHVTSSVTWLFDSPWGFPVGGQWSPGVYLARLLRYSAWNILPSQPWPSGSRDVIDHVTIRLPMGCFL